MPIIVRCWTNARRSVRSLNCWVMKTRMPIVRGHGSKIAAC